jgi:pyruvate-formate lyase-activating enzyme
MGALPEIIGHPMPLSETIKTLIRNAWDGGYACLLTTNGFVRGTA